MACSGRRGGRRRRSGKARRKIAGVNEALGQDVVQVLPFGADLGVRRAIQQILELERVGSEITELIFQTAAVSAEIDVSIR